MKNVIRGVSAAAVLLAAVASNAWAFGPFTNTQLCGGDKFETCATLTTSFDATTNTLSITIANTSSNGDKFTSFGVRDLPAGVSVVAASSTKPASLTAWNAGGNNANDIQAEGWGMNGDPNTLGISNDGNSYAFTLVFDGTVDPATLAFALHSQAGPGGCSTKLIVDANNGVNTITSPAEGCAGTTTVPEPVTMTLLATGLAGMGGAGLIRRKKSVK